MKIGVIEFPGTLDNKDALRAVKIAGAEPVSLWYKTDDCFKVDAIIIPGGFSYGDYLRCGAISALSPIMEKVKDMANAGVPILGICNGFQILTEAHLLPGALSRNNHQKFICKDQKLEVVNNQTSWTKNFSKSQIITIPLKNGEGRFTADQKTIDMLESEDRVVFRYCEDDPNGSLNNIAGITNETGNVVGLMPHPEHGVEKGYASGVNKDIIDSLEFFKSVIKDFAK